MEEEYVQTYIEQLNAGNQSGCTSFGGRWLNSWWLGKKNQLLLLWNWAWKKALYSAHVDATMTDLKELISDKEANLGVTKRNSDDLITLCSSNGYLVFLFHDTFLDSYCCLNTALCSKIYVSSYSRHSRGFPSLGIQENYWSVESLE